MFCSASYFTRGCCSQDATVDDLLDVIEGGRVYMPAIYVLNKIDQITIEELDIIDRVPHHVPISAAHEWNLDEVGGIFSLMVVPFVSLLFVSCWLL